MGSDDPICPKKQSISSLFTVNKTASNKNLTDQADEPYSIKNNDEQNFLIEQTQVTFYDESSGIVWFQNAPHNPKVVGSNPTPATK